MHFKDPNLVGRAETVFHGTKHAETMMFIPFEIQNGIHHMFQHTRTSKRPLFCHVTNDKNGNLIEFRKSHQRSCRLTHMRHASGYPVSLRMCHRLNRVDNDIVRLQRFNLRNDIF